VVLDGEEGEHYDAIGFFTFSSVGNRYAYSARKGDNWVVVVDGEESRPYDSFIFDLQFSPDGQQIAYGAEFDGREVIVLDGEEITQYDRAIDPTFSANGDSFGFRAKRGGNWLIVINGVEGIPHRVFPTPPRFSPDGSRFGYIVEGEIEYVVIDGEIGPGYYSVTPPTFSRTGLRAAYRVRESKDGPWFYVVDGIAADKHDDMVYGMIFSPNENRFAYIAQVDEGEMVIVDGEFGKVYDQIEVLFGPEFTSPNVLRYVAFEGDQMLLVEEEIGQ
jgi:hypothetical protein